DDEGWRKKKASLENSPFQQFAQFFAHKGIVLRPQTQFDQTNSGVLPPPHVFDEKQQSEQLMEIEQLKDLSLQNDLEGHGSEQTESNKIPANNNTRLELQADVSELRQEMDELKNKNSQLQNELEDVNRKYRQLLMMTGRKTEIATPTTTYSPKELKYKDYVVYFTE
ncbi:hypothetical protein PENTCL1PPCAC_12054, partial [Pristionchus entomophagus]